MYEILFKFYILLFEYGVSISILLQLCQIKNRIFFTLKPRATICTLVLRINYLFVSEEGYTPIA